MTKHETRKTELLKIIADAPAIAPGLAMSRSLTCSKPEYFSKALKDLTESGLVLRVGLGEKSQYHLTDKGHTELHGLIESTDVDSDEKELAGAVNDEPTSKDQMPDQPLPVIDSDRTTLQEALAQLEELTADMRRPMNLFDLIEFNRRGAEMIRAKAPVPAALMESSANALERAYCQQ